MKRLNYEEIKSYFYNNGCILLDLEYKNNRKKMDFICKCGEYYARNYDSFKKFPHCRKCGHKQASIKRAFTQEQVSQVFSSQNCELLNEYKDCRTPVFYKCSCGGTSWISFDNFKKGRRCKNCGVKKITGSGHGKWIKDREKVRLDKLFRKKCYKALRSTLKALDKNKCNKTKEILGYSPKELKSYITQHPNWNKVKDYRWHLDHIFPIQAFVDYGITDIKLINRLDNLQPLTYQDNISKSDNYCKKGFEEWLKKIQMI